MREVKYVRWKAWVNVGWSALVVLAGVALTWNTGEPFPGLLVAFVGAVMVHVARLPLLEKDVLLRLTPTRIWTKELGWQQWSQVLVVLERMGRGQTGGYRLIIHRPNEFTPRFFESVSALDISEEELRQWLDRYAMKRQ